MSMRRQMRGVEGMLPPQLHWSQNVQPRSDGFATSQFYSEVLIPSNKNPPLRRTAYATSTQQEVGRQSTVLANPFMEWCVVETWIGTGAVTLVRAVILLRAIQCCNICLPAHYNNQSPARDFPILMLETLRHRDTQNRRPSEHGMERWNLLAAHVAVLHHQI